MNRPGERGNTPRAVAAITRTARPRVRQPARTGGEAREGKVGAAIAPPVSKHRRDAQTFLIRPGLPSPPVPPSHGAVKSFIPSCFVLAATPRRPFAQSTPAVAPAAAPADPIKVMVGRLELEKYKSDGQGPDEVRRPPAGYGSQPGGGGLDRGAAQELRLRQHGPYQV